MLYSVVLAQQGSSFCKSMFEFPSFHLHYMILNGNLRSPSHKSKDELSPEFLLT